jgi:hypothetical protein
MQQKFSEIRTPYKMFTERKEKDKASKIKGRTERQLKMLEGAQNKGKSGGLKPKIGQGEK